MRKFLAKLLGYFLLVIPSEILLSFIIRIFCSLFYQLTSFFRKGISTDACIIQPDGLRIMHPQFCLCDTGLRSCLLFDSVVRISENKYNSEILFSGCEAVKRQVVHLIQNSDSNINPYQPNCDILLIGVLLEIWTSSLYKWY